MAKNKINSEKQAPLSLEQVKTYIAKGPTFDNKYLHSSKAKYLAVAVVLGTFATALFIRFYPQETQEPIQQTAVISQTVVRNDNQTLLARRAISEYLATHPEVKLSNGVRLFLETSLAQSRRGSARLTVGSTVEFPLSEIESLIEKSKTLSPIQLRKWENLAKKIRF